MSTFNALRKAAADSHRPLHDVLIEALRLRFSSARLGISDYLRFHLAHKDLSLARKREFAGNITTGTLKDMLADERARFICRDKLTTYALLRGHDLPYPAVRAVYGSLRPASTRCLSTPMALAAYLRDPANLPVYLKPSWGSHGEHNALLVSCEQDTLTLGDGTGVDLMTFINGLGDNRTLGWLLQEPMRAHPELRALTGTEKISSIRLCTVHDGVTVHPFMAILKVNRGDSDNDDFINGTLGNAVAAIDVRTGELLRAVAGTHENEVVNPRHPKTGRELVGFRIPQWDEVLRLALDAHRALPTMVCPHWDFAVTDQGVKIIEINSFGSLSFIQRAHRQGFMNERLIGWLRARAARGMLDPDMLRMDRLSLKRRLGLESRYWQWRNGIEMRRYGTASPVTPASPPPVVTRNGAPQAFT